MATARLKFDENIARDAVTLARRQNVDVETVADEQLAGAPDEVIAAACSSEGRVLVTLDLDFADVRAYPPAATPGIIVLRPQHQTIAAEVSLVDELLGRFALLDPTGQLWIVEPGRVRIRS